MAPSIATPTLLRDPGFIFRAPIGTALPANTVAGSVFTDDWAAAWVPIGATEEGSTLAYEMSSEAIRVAELFDPVAYAVTETSGSFSFAMADYTLQKLKFAMNGGTMTLVSGTGATALTSLEPPDPADVLRCMIGWQSLDATVRIVARQVINASAIESAFQRAPAKSLIPVQFQFERPAAAKAFTVFSAGTTRSGTVF
jgi:hypothetical protein